MSKKVKFFCRVSAIYFKKNLMYNQLKKEYKCCVTGMLKKNPTNLEKFASFEEVGVEKLETSTIIYFAKHK